jgi:hypothetical protein
MELMDNVKIFQSVNAEENEQIINYILKCHIHSERLLNYLQTPDADLHTDEQEDIIIDNLVDLIVQKRMVSTVLASQKTLTADAHERLTSFGYFDDRQLKTLERMRHHITEDDIKSLIHYTPVFEEFLKIIQQ